MWKWGTFLIILFTIVTLAGIKVANSQLEPIQQQPQENITPQVEITARNLITEINKKRIEAGVRNLSENDSLNRASNQKTNEFFANNHWDANSNNKNTWNFITEAGYSYDTASLLLGKGYTSTTDVINGWMNSDNRKELLNSGYTDLGLSIRDGTIQGENTKIIVLFLANKAVKRNVLSLESNQIDCIGPDWKHFTTTQKACDDFNRAWGKPTYQSGNTQNNTGSSTQTTSSFQPSISCVLSWGTYQLSQSNCEWYKKLDADTQESRKNYEEERQRILRETYEKMEATSKTTFQTTPINTNIVVPTSPQIITPTPKCTTIGWNTQLCNKW